MALGNYPEPMSAKCTYGYQELSGRVHLWEVPTRQRQHTFRCQPPQRRLVNNKKTNTISNRVAMYAINKQLLNEIKYDMTNY